MKNIIIIAILSFSFGCIGYTNTKIEHPVSGTKLPVVESISIQLEKKLFINGKDSPVLTIDQSTYGSIEEQFEAAFRKSQIFHGIHMNGKGKYTARCSLEIKRSFNPILLFGSSITLMTIPFVGKEEIEIDIGIYDEIGKQLFHSKKKGDFTYWTQLFLIIATPFFNPYRAKTDLIEEMNLSILKEFGEKII